MNPCPLTQMMFKDCRAVYTRLGYRHCFTSGGIISSLPAVLIFLIFLLFEDFEKMS